MPWAEPKHPLEFTCADTLIPHEFGDHNFVHKDPNHSMMFTASARGPVAFSGNGLVATSVGQGIANGKPVEYVLVQTGGAAPYFYSLTLSDASGVIYRRNSQLIFGVINVRHR